MGMYMMCNPTFDYGPAEWHRDVDAADSGPLQQMQDSVREDGPTYLQWNIPLYDDKVFWVVPGSHVRINSDAENRGLMTDNRSPLPGGMPVEMQAGDALVYIHYMLHWGSSYTKEPKRRTVHGGHTVFPYWEDLGFTRHLSAESRARFEVWTARTATLKDQTERALRAVADGDPRAYAQALEDLRPGASKATKLALSIWLCKAAMNMHNLKRPDFERLPPEIRLQAAAYHGITLKWGPAVRRAVHQGRKPTGSGSGSVPWRIGSWPAKAATTPPVGGRRPPGTASSGWAAARMVTTSGSAGCCPPRHRPSPRRNLTVRGSGYHGEFRLPVLGGYLA